MLFSGGAADPFSHGPATPAHDLFHWKRGQFFPNLLHHLFAFSSIAFLPQTIVFLLHNAEKKSRTFALISKVFGIPFFRRAILLQDSRTASISRFQRIHHIWVELFVTHCYTLISKCSGKLLCQIILVCALLFFLLQSLGVLSLGLISLYRTSAFQMKTIDVLNTFYTRQQRKRDIIQ